MYVLPNFELFGNYKIYINKIKLAKRRLFNENRIKVLSLI